MGARSKKYTPIIKKIGVAYSVLVPLGFIFIAAYHYVTQL
jgi:succinate dehydrogenase / fumarate reductase cytochrome b subunit